ncbi:hypothetical protein [Halosimplex marinum]|uniref:hypothetical protein n=1 Tax=Halosimplex marinum TaxID=3396620 RepID=UPI003F57AF0C
MSSSVDLERYRGNNRVQKFVNEYRALVGVAGLLVGLLVLAAVVDAVGQAEIAGMIVAWSVLVTGVLFVFAVVPMYGIRFLPSYHKF